jgi:hypothetical protein
MKVIISITDHNSTLFTTEKVNPRIHSTDYTYNYCNIKRTLFGLAYVIRYWDDYKTGEYNHRNHHRPTELNSTMILYPSGIKRVDLVD